MHSFCDAGWMFQRLFLNTFGSSTRVKWGISRTRRHTALSRDHFSLYGDSILSLGSQNTLIKTSVQHFPTTHEAVTDTFMLDTNHRSTFPPFSRPYTFINSRYSTICKSGNGVAIRVILCMGFFRHLIIYIHTKLIYKLIYIKINKRFSLLNKVQSYRNILNTLKCLRIIYLLFVMRMEIFGV